MIDLQAELGRGVALLDSDPHDGVSILSSVREAAVASEDFAVAGHATYALARDAVNRSKLNEALLLIEEARRLFTEADMAIAAMRTDLGRMHALDDLGRHADAAKVAQALILELDRVAPLRSTDTDAEATWLGAAAHENLGVALGYMGRNHDALDAYATAADLYVVLGQDDDVARVTANRGVDLAQLGRPLPAIEALSKASRAYEISGDRIASAKCSTYLARSYLQLGELDHAVGHLESSEQQLDAHNASTELIRARLAIADVYAGANLDDEALATYEAVATQSDELGLRHDSAAAHFGLASVLARAGDNASAGEYLRLAEEGFGAVGDQVMQARSRLVWAELPDVAEPVTLVEEAIAQLQRIDRPVELALARLQLAELCPDRAAEILAANALTVADVDLPHLRWRMLYARGLLAFRQGYLSSAVDLLLDATAVIDELRSRVGTEGARLPFLNGRDGVHRDLALAYLALGNTELAYELCDRMRTPTLIDRMVGRLAPNAVRSASIELNAIYNQLIESPAGTRPELRNRARELERSLDGASSLGGHAASSAGGGPSECGQADDPEGVPVAHHPGPNPAGSSVDNRATVTYQLFGDEVAAFCEVGGRVRIIRFVTSAELVGDLLDSLDLQWSWLADGAVAGPLVDQLTQSATETLRAGHRALIAPLNLPEHITELVIIPHGLLARVPFAALHDGSDYLLDTRTVVTLPSRTAGAKLVKRPPNNDFSVLAVSVADDSIPAVQLEAEAVARSVSRCVVRTGAEATVADFKSEAGVHDVLHVACHGIHRPDSPWFSALKLGDGWITASEVGGLDLSGQLVVLSACESGRQTNAGTELLGLPWGFLAAGASAVVVNLWSVDDRASASLFSHFYDHLAAGHPVPAALQMAQRDVRAVYSHPYYWAAAIAIGAPGHMTEPHEPVRPQQTSKR